MGATFDVGDIPADLQEQAEEYREALVEAAVSLDDEAMEAYLEGTVRAVVSRAGRLSLNAEVAALCHWMGLACSEFFGGVCIPLTKIRIGFQNGTCVGRPLRWGL